MTLTERAVKLQASNCYMQPEVVILIRDLLAEFARLERIEAAAKLAHIEFDWMLRAFPDRKGGKYETAFKALNEALTPTGEKGRG